MEGYRSGHNGAVLKTVRAASSQGFESLTLRQLHPNLNPHTSLLTACLGASSTGARTMDKMKRRAVFARRFFCAQKMKSPENQISQAKPKP